MRPPSPAMWYDANGHEWGQLGPNGELPDRDGNPLPGPKPPPDASWLHMKTESTPIWPVFGILLAMIAITILIVWAAWVGKFDSPAPQVTPATYGYPCQEK